jgi:hypothetical protein
MVIYIWGLIGIPHKNKCTNKVKQGRLNELFCHEFVFHLVRFWFHTNEIEPTTNERHSPWRSVVGFRATRRCDAEDAATNGIEWTFWQLSVWARTGVRERQRRIHLGFFVLISQCNLLWPDEDDSEWKVFYGMAASTMAPIAIFIRKCSIATSSTRSRPVRPIGLAPRRCPDLISPSIFSLSPFDRLLGVIQRSGSALLDLFSCSRESSHQMREL